MLATVPNAKACNPAACPAPSAAGDAAVLRREIADMERMVERKYRRQASTWFSHDCYITCTLAQCLATAQVPAFRAPRLAHLLCPAVL